MAPSRASGRVPCKSRFAERGAKSKRVKKQWRNSFEETRNVPRDRSRRRVISFRELGTKSRKIHDPARTTVCVDETSRNTRVATAPRSPTNVSRRLYRLLRRRMSCTRPNCVSAVLTARARQYFSKWQKEKTDKSRARKCGFSLSVEEMTRRKWRIDKRAQ